MEMKAGETVDFSVKYYQDIEPFTTNTENVVSTITTQLMNIFFVNNPRYIGIGSEQIEEQANNTFGSNSTTSNFLFNLLKNPDDNKYTKAQLVYLYYDHEFNLLENSSGSLAATEEGVLGSLLLEGLRPERDGFLYIFAINETSNPIDFDNLIVAHKTGTLLAVNDYYPFGLRWNGQGSPFHKYQIGGKEYEEELNLNTYDFHARQMDPVLGRFWGVDPMSSERVSFSPFNYVQNNPMNRVDPTGMLDAQYENEDAKRQDIMDDAAYDEIGKQFYVESYVWTKGRDQHNYYTNHDKFKENSVLDDGTIDISALGIRDQMSMKELRESLERNAQSNGGVNTDAWGNGLNAFGFGNGAKTEIIDYAVRSGSSQAGLRAELQTLGKAGTRYLNAAKGLSKGAGILGVAFTGVDAYQKGQWQNYHTADVLIGLGTTLMLSGPWGWAAGGAYFLMDMGVQSYSGKSITENLFD